MKTIKHAILAAALGIATSATFAQAPADPSKAGELTDAEVRKVDKAQGKVTLKHAEIKSLDMPMMTMVFSVRDKAMLDNVKPGDKVKIRATSDNGKLTVVEMVPAK